MLFFLTDNTPIRNGLKEWKVRRTRRFFFGHVCRCFDCFNINLFMILIWFYWKETNQFICSFKTRTWKSVEVVSPATLTARRRKISHVVPLKKIFEADDVSSFTFTFSPPVKLHLTTTLFFQQQTWHKEYFWLVPIGPNVAFSPPFYLL